MSFRLSGNLRNRSRRNVFPTTIPKHGRGIVRPHPATPEQVMARLLRIEFGLGRTREVPLGPRTIDLDLLLYRNETRATKFLTLPHPRLQQRRFVLEPLAELCPNLVHPTLRRTIGELPAPFGGHLRGEALATHSPTLSTFPEIAAIMPAFVST